MKRFFSILVAILMVMALIPMSVFAQDTKAPATRGETITWDFEGETDGWTFVDNDGDGYNWQLASVLMAGYLIPAYNGEDCISSQSYISGVGALTPDNWAISPAVNADDLSAVTMSFWAQAQDADWAQEHFGVAVGNSADPSEMEMISEWDMTASVTRDSGNWYQYTVTLENASELQPGEIFFAIRHFNCTDWFYINVDCVEVTVEESVTPPDQPIAIHEVTVNGWGDPVEGVIGIDHVFLEAPDDAPYFIIYGGWLDETDQQQLWSEEHVFIAGHVYSEGCQIWCDEGYYFADDCVFVTEDEGVQLDPEWCYVDPDENYICYMNSVPVECEGAIPGVLWGDADGDGDVDAADGVLLIRFCMELEPEQNVHLELCDVNGDGNIDFADALLIMRKVMGVVECFPVELD